MCSEEKNWQKEVDKIVESVRNRKTMVFERKSIKYDEQLSMPW
jgi:hypothetical protein